MAKSRKQRDVPEEDFGLDEVDAFHAEREKILLEEAAPTRRFKYQRDDDDLSDDSVMNISEDDSDEEDVNGADEDDEDAELFGKKDDDLELEEEEEGAWGDRKSAYYGADEIEDEESAKQIEEEALRQQKKHLQELNIDDYVDEELEEEWTKNAKKHDYGDVLDSKDDFKQTLQDISKLDPKTRKKLISTSYPEYIPLSKELTKLKPILDDLSKRQNQNEVSNVKFTALSAYLGSITSYFAVFVEQSRDDEPFTMKEHPVMEAILSSKELWRQASLLEVNRSKQQKKALNSKMGKIDRKHQKPLDSKMDGIDSDSEDEDEFDSPDETRNVEESEEGESESDNELDIDISKPREFKKAKAQAVEDFAEGQIADVDVEEKKARKKTLRFYTSKIDQQAKKKDERYTGDLDIPYKERLFERQQRLIEEARKRGLNDNNGADLDDNDSFDEEDASAAKSVNDGFQEDYYNSVKQSTQERKEKRMQLHRDAVKAAKEGKLAELKENVDDDGKRAVNYQILKNKGLTPHRNKDNRNSRVKKRKKYEKAQKKLKSVRAVFSTPTGAYEGEMTGIKKNLSKSVKFKS